MTPRPPAGVVLTGGSSTRMGTDKALMPVDGRPMAVRVAEALSGAGCRPVWCQGGNVEQLTRLGLDVVPDTEPGEGPVVAILAALRHADGADVMVAACDLVDLDAASVGSVLAAVTDGTDVVSARSDGGLHLLSWWSAQAASALAAAVDDGVRSYRRAMEALTCFEVDVPASAVRNANRPDDVRRRPS